MKFESGMLGFLIVVLAIGGGIAGTYLLSAEPTTEEITKYNLVTDVTGLFDTDESPQYFDYDLSQNYTGYYTQDTIINGVNYWGGADYVSSRVNNYPVKVAPQNDVTGTYTVSDYSSDLTTSTPPGANSINVYYFTSGQPGDDVENAQLKIMNAHSYTLTSLITALGMDSYHYIIIESPTENLSDLVFFTTTDRFEQIGGNPPTFSAPFISEEYSETYPGYEEYTGCLSCRINTATQRVDYYYTNTASTSAFLKSTPLSDAVILTGSSDNDTVNIRAYDPEVIDYMDISRGVRVTGVTA